MSLANCPVCGTTAWTVEDDNGVTDPAETRVEYCECEHGHSFTNVLEGR